MSHVGRDERVPICGHCQLIRAQVSNIAVPIPNAFTRDQPDHFEQQNMTYENLTAEELIRALELAGRYPNPDLINAVWERKEEATPLLLQMFREAYHDDWPDEDDPRLYRFIHAGKFMLAWHVKDALPVFADMYIDDEMHDWCEWFEEDPADYGPVAIPYFARVLKTDSGKQWHYGRGLAGSILSQIALRRPETHDDVVSIFHALLPSLEEIPRLTDEDYDDMWSAIVIELAHMQDQTSREQILALFDADMIDPMFIDRAYYLRVMNAKNPQRWVNKPYDLLKDYEEAYEADQRQQKRIRTERRTQEQQPVRPARVTSGRKIGRNEPCPCGSGKKYKKCHGRPGMQWQG